MFCTVFVVALLAAQGPYAAATPTSPRFSLPLAARFASDGTARIVDIDRARVAAMKTHHHLLLTDRQEVPARRAHPQTIAVTNTAINYIASVSIGQPPTTYNLLVDTGSANTWINASTPYRPTDSSIRTGESVHLTYGTGGFSGTEYMDQLSLSPNLAIKNQSIGVANSTYDFDTSGAVPVDGILGIGPVDLTRGSLSNKTETIPTVVDNLYSQGLIAENLISISFRPSANGSTSDKNGELSFGSVDGSKHVGSLTYVPITKQQPAGVHWGIDQSVRYDNKSILNSTGGVIDSGSTLIYLASDAYDAYKVATGATLDSTTGLLRIEPSAYDKLKNLDFVIGGETFTLVPNAQIWPRALNTYIGGSNDWVYLVVNDLGEPSGNGLDFINGYAWMERFYTVYDGGANRMGFAKTSWTNATTN